MSELTALVAAIGASPSAEQLELLRTLVLQGALGDVKTVNVTDKAVDESSEKAQLAYTLRGRVWALLLGCGSTVAVDVAEYLSLITKKRADDSTYATIRGDTKRTYRKHKSFSERVSPQSMSRICNAISHKHGALYTYKQGMGCLPAVFLYTMPEPVAFRCVDRVISAVLPYHFAPPYYHGSRASVTFTKELLEAVDIELATHLNTLSQHQWPFMVVQPFIVSIGLANRPFDQLLPLFDFLIAAGFENNVLLVIAQLVDMRNALLNAQSYGEVIKLIQQRDGTWPDLRARYLCVRALQLIEQLEGDTQGQALLLKLGKHVTDKATIESLVPSSQH